MTSSGLWRHKYTTMRSWDELSWFSWGFLGFATMSTSYCGLVRSIQCSVWACLWMSGTFFTILIEISHYAYFIVLKNCRVLVVIWPTWPVTWDRGYESHWIQKNIFIFFFYFFLSSLMCIYYTRHIISTGYSIRERGNRKSLKVLKRRRSKIFWNFLWDSHPRWDSHPQSPRKRRQC